VPFIEWEARYLLGVDQFDMHHKHLVDLLNEAYDLFVTKEENELELQRILDDLTEYSNYHFQLEENWMTQVEYHKQMDHVLEHKRFIYKLYEFNKQFKEDKANLTLELVSFLRRWLLDHILNCDAEYGRFIHKRPVPQP